MSYYSLVPIFFVLILSSAALMLTQRSLPSLFNIYAGQSFLIAVLAVILFLYDGHTALLFIAGLTFISKVIVIPVFMRRIQRDIKYGRDLEFRYLSPVSSIIISTALIFFTYRSLSRFLAEISPDVVFSLGAVIGVSLLLIGMLIIFSRKMAITKTVGYLTMENGVLLFSLFIAELPFIIEVMIILDLVMLIVLSAILAAGIDSDPTIQQFHRRLNPFGLWSDKDDDL